MTIFIYITFNGPHIKFLAPMRLKKTTNLWLFNLMSITVGRGREVWGGVTITPLGQTLKSLICVV